MLSVALNLRGSPSQSTTQSRHAGTCTATWPVEGDAHDEPPSTDRTWSFSVRTILPRRWLRVTHDSRTESHDLDPRPHWLRNAGNDARKEV
jgi:hypothetical protein